MSNQNRFLLLFSLILYSFSGLAQNIEQIYLRDGSVLEGYLSEQIPGKYITIQTTKATVVVNSDSLQNQIIENFSWDTLSPEWRAWVAKNPRYSDNAEKSNIQLSTLVFKNKKFSNVYILENGSLIKFLDLTPKKYSFFWGDMSRTVKNRRPDNQFSGVKELLELTDQSTVEGQIIEQVPGKNLKILTSHGDILSYQYDDIKKILTSKLNPEMDLWSQVQLLDRIKVKGSGDLIEGFISSRTLSKDLTIELKDGSSRTFPLGMILSYEKVPNSKFIPIFDKKLKEGEILLNGEPAYFDKLQAQGQYLLLGELVSAQVRVGDTICVEGKFSDPNIAISLVKAKMNTFTRENNNKEESITCPAISFQDIVQSSLPLTREITPLKNTKISFIVNMVGDYVLYIQGKEGYIVINVTEKS